ncbi:hypothetical protein ACFQ1S_00095 [Kibdelosporangium lantanae]|uniref:Uncharacterized protein n=1 Tax=Kibdelosporangium lantanae TaxID=1497396 RepID=A0ABW3M2J3_9PSEU
MVSHVAVARGIVSNPFDDAPEMMLAGNAPIDNTKAHVLEKLYESGLLNTFDRYLNVPPWASAAWVLAGNASAKTREQVGLEIAVSAPTPIGMAVADGDTPDLGPGRSPARLAPRLASSIQVSYVDGC